MCEKVTILGYLKLWTLQPQEADLLEKTVGIVLKFVLLKFPNLISTTQLSRTPGSVLGPILVFFHLPPIMIFITLLVTRLQYDT